MTDAADITFPSPNPDWGRVESCVVYGTSKRTIALDSKPDPGWLSLLIRDDTAIEEYAVYHSFIRGEGGEFERVR